MSANSSAMLPGPFRTMSVRPEIVVIVEPEAIDVVPRVGAEYEDSGDPPIKIPPKLSGVISVSNVPWIVKPFFTLKFLSDI